MGGRGRSPLAFCFQLIATPPASLPARTVSRPNCRPRVIAAFLMASVSAAFVASETTSFMLLLVFSSVPMPERQNVEPSWQRTVKVPSTRYRALNWSFPSFWYFSMWTRSTLTTSKDQPSKQKAVLSCEITKLPGM